MRTINRCRARGERRSTLGELLCADSRSDERIDVEGLLSRLRGNERDGSKSEAQLCDALPCADRHVVGAGQTGRTLAPTIHLMPLAAERKLAQVEVIGAAASNPPKEAQKPYPSALCRCISRRRQKWRNLPRRCNHQHLEQFCHDLHGFRCARPRLRRTREPDDRKAPCNSERASLPAPAMAPSG